MFTNFVNYIQRNIGTTAVTLVTCPAAQQLVVNQLSCANTTGLLVTCSVTVTRSGTVVFIVNNATVPAGGSLICAGDDQKIVLMAGDVLQVQSSTASSIDAVVSGVLNDFNRSAVVPAPPTSPVATFSITPSTTSTSEGGTVTYSVTTTNVPNGTVLYWQNFGTTTAQDFTDDRNDGEFVITSNAGSFTRTLKNNGVGGDLGGESSETIQIAVQFRPGYLGGCAVAGATTVTVQPDIVASGLRLVYDAANPTSYPGSGTSWFDLSGNSNNGTLVNGVGYNSANGGSLVFDGVDDQIDVGSTLSSQVGPNLTVGAFAQISSVVSKNTLLSFNGIYNFFLPGNRLTTTYQLYWDSVSGWKNGNTTSWNTNQWYYFAWTISGTSLTFYLNGVADGTVSISNPVTPSGQVRVGFANAGEYATGRIANLHVYNTALSASEILQNFNSARGRYGI
jgi:hypothetical protein